MAERRTRAGRTRMRDPEVLRESLGPAPTTPAERLTHTLRAHRAQPDDAMAIYATESIYGPRVVTGLTWGDLRALAPSEEAERRA